MEKLTETLYALQKKYGDITMKIVTEDGCDSFLYDEGCRSCKGNGMGN